MSSIIPARPARVPATPVRIAAASVFRAHPLSQPPVRAEGA